MKKSKQNEVISNLRADMAGLIIKIKGLELDKEELKRRLIEFMERKKENICFRCKKLIKNEKEKFMSDIETPNKISYYHRVCFNKSIEEKTKKAINLNALGGYLMMKDYCKFLDKLIKNGCPSKKELRKRRKESGIYLANLKSERDEALRSLKWEKK